MIKAKHLWLSFTISMSLVTPGFSATSLSLDEATELALKKSENIEQALIDIELAKEQVEEAWASLYPQVSASIQGIRHTKSQVLQFNGTSVPVKQDWEQISTLRVEQIIYSFGKVGSALKMAKLSTKMQNTAKDVVEREIRYAVELAYFNVQLSKKLVEISKDSLQNARNNKKALQKRFQGGRVPRFDNLKMESDIANRIPKLRNAEKNLKLAYLQLNLITEMDIGARPNLTTDLKSNFTNLNEHKLLKESIETPKIKLSQLQVDFADKQVELAKSYHYPTISAFGNINHSGTGDTLPVEDENLFDSSSIGIAINIPIFEGGAVSSRHRQEALKKVRAQVEHKKQKEEVELEVISNIEEYKTNKERLKSAQVAVNLAKEAYILTRNRYETGGATRNDLNDSENSLTGARMQLETIKFELIQNESSLKRLTEKVVTNG